MELKLNIGCGNKKLPGHLNVDKYESCDPDFVYDLNDIPWPWKDGSFFEVRADHVFEHLKRETWFEVFKECARVLATNGLFYFSVPDVSNDGNITFRDHNIIFDNTSFHGIQEYGSGWSAWAVDEQYKVPLILTAWIRIPFKEYTWMLRVPGLFPFCARHMRNFAWGQEFIFQKVELNENYGTLGSEKMYHRKNLG